MGLDIAFSFDTTGSMYPCLSQVRNNMVSTINALFNDVQDIRIAIIAHGDYCDENKPYTIKYLDFSTDKKEICEFINNVERTGGGDVPECYELVLQTARKHLSWGANSQAVLVMIGDSTPHPVDYPENIYKIDWEKEAYLYRCDSIQIYSIHSMASCRKFSKSFYETIANKTNGMYLTLEQFSEINDIIVGICYQQKPNKDMLNRFVERIIPTASRNLKHVLSKLSGITSSDEAKYIPNLDGLVPVPTSRFQLFEIPYGSKVAIKKFIQEQGIEFKIGRGFYELTKPEDIQQYKEIILQDIATGDFFNGSEVRQLLDLLPQIIGGKGEGTTQRINPRTYNLKNYRVFVQSTSVNRALIPETHFLYEVPDWDVVESTSISKKLEPVETKLVTKKLKKKESPPKYIINENNTDYIINDLKINKNLYLGKL